MEVDVAVVGSGLCGTLAARACAGRGLRVTVLEAGPGLRGRMPSAFEAFQKAAAPALRIDPRQWAFRSPKGFDWHRVRARGGRTLLWGGWMARPDPAYFAARRDDDAPWPVELERLQPWVRRAEQALRVRAARPKALHQRLSALGLRPVAKRESTLRPGARPLTAADLPLAQLRTGAVVLGIDRDRGGLVVRLAGGEAIEAKTVVLAASPVETARIAFASGVGSRRFALHDHLIAGAIAISSRAPGRARTSALLYPPEPRVRYSVEVRGPQPLEQLDDEDLQSLGFTRPQASERSFYVVFAMGETDPHQPRVVELTRAKDELGRPVPRFVSRPHTRYERSLAERMNETVITLARSLSLSSATAFPIYDAFAFSSGGHEVGTLLGAVDAHGALAGLPGVFVADGSAVPGATDRHPSLLLAANALRVADEVARARRA